MWATEHFFCVYITLPKHKGTSENSIDSVKYLYNFREFCQPPKCLFRLGIHSISGLHMCTHLAWSLTQLCFHYWPVLQLYINIITYFFWNNKTKAGNSDVDFDLRSLENVFQRLKEARVHVELLNIFCFLHETAKHTAQPWLFWSKVLNFSSANITSIFISCHGNIANQNIGKQYTPQYNTV